MGYREPSFELPNNFRFHSIARAHYPQNRWSDALIKFLRTMKDEYCVLMLEDYWINRPVDVYGIDVLYQYIQTRDDILRFDLTVDVLHVNGDARDANDCGFIGHYDLVEKRPGQPYRMSYQAGLWNTRLLLSLLVEGKDPWQSEIHTAVPDDINVYGVRQWPLRYINSVYKGELDMREIERLAKDDLDIVKRTLPKDMKVRRYA